MFQLIEPIWLFALAGIAIPVLIHLWNIKKGKTLKVGSIALLTQRSTQNASSLRLSDILLLVLRCIFITLLVLLLSKPLWQLKADQDKVKGWVLMEPGKLKEGYVKFKPLIDSLLQTGYEFHYFYQGFKKQDLKAVLENKSDTAFVSRYSYWALLQMLEQVIPGNLPLQLFTTNSLSKFSGSRPGLSISLNWKTYTPSDSVFTAITAAYLTPADSIRFTKMESTPTGISYVSRSISAIVRRDTGYVVNIEGGKLKVADITTSIHNNIETKNEQEVDTSTLRVCIYTDNYISDANYLKAAIEAVQQYTSRKITVSLVRNITAIPAGQQWLFWLSESPASKGVQANYIFSYASGKITRVSSSLNIPQVGLNDGPVTLYKLVATDLSPNLSSGITWRDGFGKPVLYNDTSAGNNYYFLSRFDPDWNDLVWSEKFPVIMMNLILDKAGHSGFNIFSDKRKIASQQLQPDFVSDANIVKSGILKKNADLSVIIWVAAFVTFLLERILSFNKKDQQLYG